MINFFEALLSVKVVVLIFLFLIEKKVCLKSNFWKVGDIYNKREKDMKQKEQQFINAWESFLNDVPDTKSQKQNNKNDLTFTEDCFMIIIMTLIVFIGWLSII